MATGKALFGERHVAIVHADNPERLSNRPSHDDTVVSRDFHCRLLGWTQFCIDLVVAAARTLSAIGLQVNQCGKARTLAGRPSSLICSFRRASEIVSRPSQTR